MQRCTYSFFPASHTSSPDALFFPQAPWPILARLFTQPSPWYSATSCSVAAHLFIPFICIYQQATAVSEPPAAVLSSQNKGEHLTVKEEKQTLHYYCTNDNYAGHFNLFFSSIALAPLFSCFFLGFICLGSSGKENTFLWLQ